MVDARITITVFLTCHVQLAWMSKILMLPFPHYSHVNSNVLYGKSLKGAGNFTWITIIILVLPYYLGSIDNSVQNYKPSLATINVYKRL